MLITQQKSIFRFLVVVREPAGWFTMWEGLGKVFIYSKEKIPDLEFYKKMCNAGIGFYSY